jgi:thiazole synthase ThiGH ThiG subunit
MSKPTDKKDLTATNLKNALWETLQQVQTGAKQPAEADAIASQAREILRTVKVQLQVVAQAKRTVPADVIVFAEK